MSGDIARGDAVFGGGGGLRVTDFDFELPGELIAQQPPEVRGASRMLVTEKVFGFLLAALGVQLALNGLSDVGVIHLITSH